MKSTFSCFWFFVKCLGFHTIEYLFQRAAGDSPLSFSFTYVTTGFGCENVLPFAFRNKFGSIIKVEAAMALLNFFIQKITISGKNFIHNY